MCYTAGMLAQRGNLEFVEKGDYTVNENTIIREVTFSTSPVASEQELADLNLQNPFIIGERVYLRPLEPTLDNHLYSTWLNDQEIRRYFSVYPTSDARGKERIDNLYKNFGHIIFGVVLKDDNRLIGLVGLKDINLLNQSAEFYVIIGDRTIQGRGYGTEATKLMIRYGFMELNLNRIQTQDMDENVGGWRADEKAGFKLEGTLREAILRQGRYHDVRVYSLLRKEYFEHLAAE
jgi:RimJ/RimL family protein N-acetyltransferase